MNDFDDDYWDDDFERYNPEAFYALSNLNRKCNTIEMYEEQKEIYEKYLPKKCLMSLLPIKESFNQLKINLNV